MISMHAAAWTCKRLPVRSCAKKHPFLRAFCTKTALKRPYFVLFCTVCHTFECAYTRTLRGCFAIAMYAIHRTHHEAPSTKLPHPPEQGRQVIVPCCVPAKNICILQVIGRAQDGKGYDSELLSPRARGMRPGRERGLSWQIPQKRHPRSLRLRDLRSRRAPF